MSSQEQSLAIRHSGPDDRAALERLAALDSAPTPSGDVLIAEAGDEPRAAIEIATGAAIADPFRPTAQLVDLLAVRAETAAAGRGLASPAGDPPASHRPAFVVRVAISPPGGCSEVDSRKEQRMWTNEHSIETTASAEAVWRLWSDVTRWPEWIADIERIELSGSFATGSKITMIPAGRDPVELRIAEAVEPERFVDEADLGDVVVRTLHRVDPLDTERNRVVYRMEISGPAADRVGPELGPQISGDFPETLAALVERAER
jgi:uncharacterized protein YndB with AHSA1/START domain